MEETKGQPYTEAEALRRAERLAGQVRFYLAAGLLEGGGLALTVAAYDRLVERQGYDPLAS